MSINDHPIAALVAECGHRLMLPTALHEAPNGKPCEACVAKQLEIAQAALDRAATALQLARAKIAQSTPERLERRRCPMPHR